MLIFDIADFDDKNAEKEKNCSINLEARNEKDENIQKKLYQTIKKVTESVEDDFHFNAAIEAIIELLNDTTTYKQEIIDKNVVSYEVTKIWKEVLDKTISLLTSFAPHIADELWQEIGNAIFTFEEK